MPKHPGSKSDDLIRQEGRTAKAQRKQPSANPYLGYQGLFESDKEYNRRQIAAELWQEGYREGRVQIS